MNKELQDIEIELFKNIFQSSVEGILVVDANGCIIKANLASAKLFGYDLDELENQEIEILIPNKFKKIHQNHREGYITKPNPRTRTQHLELWGQKKDGSQFPVNISLSPTTIAGKKAVIAFVVDITAQKKQDTLFSIRNNALASTSNGILITDAQKKGNPIIYCNAAFTKITGYKEEEVLDKNCSFLQRDDVNQKAISVIKNAIQNEQLCNVIVRNYKKDGTLFWNNVSITPVFNEDNILTNYIGVQNDVTNKVKQENLKNHTQKILELIAENQSLKTISTKITKIIEDHFKNCLASILVLDKENKVLHNYTSAHLTKNIPGNTEDSTTELKEDFFGTIEFLKKEIFVSKTEEKILWEGHKEIALKNDLKVCCSSPILSSTKNILGRFTIYSKDGRKASKEEKKILLDLSHLASIAIEAHNKGIELQENKRALEQQALELEEKVLELKKEKELLYRYMNTASSIFLVINANHKIEFANRKACEVLQVLHHEIIGKNWFNNFIPERNRKKLSAIFDQVIKSEIAPIDAYENKVLAGNRERIIQWRYGIIRDHNNYPISVISSGIDITEEKRLEKELEVSRNQLAKYAKELEKKVENRTEELTITAKQLVTSNLSLEDQIEETLAAEKIAAASKYLSSAIAKNFPNGFIIVFNRNFQIILIEGASVKPLKLDTIIFHDTTIDDFPIFSTEQKTKLKQDISKTIGGEHLSFEIRYKNQYFAANTSPLIDKEGIISSALFVYNDITAQKKIEKDTKQALEKERELNELKSRFVSMASHEFRTPLSAIQTSAILIAKQNEVGYELKREKYVNQIQKNVKQLVIILNDFLSLSKLEEGKLMTNNKLFDFVALSKTILEEVSITKNRGKNIIFSTPIKPVFINLDPKLVSHILMNLLSNAIKYSPENTDIIIKIKENDFFVSLEVKDLGIGIPEEEQDKLFERFFRAKNVQNIEGTGLGLNIVKQYVDLMGGTISFKSAINKGTTFLIKWPKLTKRPTKLINQTTK
ncbi:PAS domain S-box protein [Polaribacter litorisediminis]|uniref:PAS domain-containing sensor histidine kinase n=1 Tax=Polaribacter litorisediminis TaxID=1908341 RepID=UPI001CBFB5BE|nr:PAS domain S-box protein [Polaribacter litorisediminis]UAM98161.1 PAS domain S-box protein [Polaribacter litorisediminis]